MTDTTPTQEHARADYITGLRTLADLLERLPEVPHYDLGSISFALGGTQDEAFEVIDRAAAALAAAGIDHEYREYGEHSRGVEFRAAGVRYGFSRLTDQAREKDNARRSYEPVIQLDPAPAHATAGNEGGR
ncbi:hypothetical protein DPM19_05705 [Actinomadura craniellae]|uniref:Uncharacterized protein n=1 Tax=Actinomadura craniellae TaxID=2231787 RepID=A0A365HDP1_9ACTN|nr:hypothetical protein [Actinomadura craniellae]RAY16373.1 hypothetical protein DPM19_05705 [Actinomadura craniellae]